MWWFAIIFVIFAVSYFPVNKWLQNRRIDKLLARQAKQERMDRYFDYERKMRYNVRNKP